MVVGVQPESQALGDAHGQLNTSLGERGQRSEELTMNLATRAWWT